MPKVKATWDTPIVLTPKGHAAALFIIANDRELDAVCDPQTRDNVAVVNRAAEDVRNLSGLMKWQGVDRADVRTITEDAA